MSGGFQPACKQTRPKPCSLSPVGCSHKPSEGKQYVPPCCSKYSVKDKMCTSYPKLPQTNIQKCPVCNASFNSQPGCDTSSYSPPPCPPPCCCQQQEKDRGPPRRFSTPPPPCCPPPSLPNFPREPPSQSHQVPSLHAKSSQGASQHRQYSASPMPCCPPPTPPCRPAGGSPPCPTNNPQNFSPNNHQPDRPRNGSECFPNVLPPSFISNQPPPGCPTCQPSMSSFPSQCPPQPPKNEGLPPMPPCIVACCQPCCSCCVQCCSNCTPMCPCSGIKITEVHPYGNYVKLVNTSCTKAEYISGCYIVQIQGGCCLSIYKIPPCVYLGAQCSLKVFSCSSDPGCQKNPMDLVFKELNKWSCGVDISTVFCSCSGEPISCVIGCCCPAICCECSIPPETNIKC